MCASPIGLVHRVPVETLARALVEVSVVAEAGRNEQAAKAEHRAADRALATKSVKKNTIIAAGIKAARRLLLQIPWGLQDCL